MSRSRAGGGITRGQGTAPIPQGHGHGPYFPALSPTLLSPQHPSPPQVCPWLLLHCSSPTFPVSSGPGCRVTEQGKFWGICGEGKEFSSSRKSPNLPLNLKRLERDSWG